MKPCDASDFPAQNSLFRRRVRQSTKAKPAKLTRSELASGTVAPGVLSLPYPEELERQQRVAYDPFPKPQGEGASLRRAVVADGGGGCPGGKSSPVPTERRQRLLDGVWSWRALETGRIEGFYLCRDGRPVLEPSATASPSRPAPPPRPKRAKERLDKLAKGGAVSGGLLGRVASGRRRLLPIFVSADDPKEALYIKIE